MSDNLDHETTPSQGSAKSSASEELAQKALQALESIQKATPGPNAFAHAAKARVQHHIAGNAFAAQNRPSNTPALAAIHPALRAEAVVQATLMRAGSEPVFVHDSLLTTQEQAECANKPAVRPVTPSRDQAVAQPRSTPLRNIMNRLKGVSTRSRTHQAEIGKERHPSPSSGPKTPAAQRQPSNSISVAGPTPPAKDTPPVGPSSTPDSSITTHGDLEIIFPTSDTLGVHDNGGGDGGMLYTPDEELMDRLALTHVEVKAGATVKETQEGDLLSPTVFQPSAQSSTAAVQRVESVAALGTDSANGTIHTRLSMDNSSLDDSLQSMIREMFKEEVSKLARTDFPVLSAEAQVEDETLQMLKRIVHDIAARPMGRRALGDIATVLLKPIEDLYANVTANAGMLDQHEKILQEYRKDVGNADVKHAAQLRNLIRTVEVHEEHFQLVDQLLKAQAEHFENMARSPQSLEKLAQKLSQQTQSNTALKEKIAAQANTNESLVGSQIASIVRRMADITKQVSELKVQMDQIPKTFLMYGDRMDGLEKDQKSLMRCRLHIVNIQAQLETLALLAPDSFVLPDDIRRKNEELRTDLLKRASGHKELTASIQNALPGEYGHLTWVVDVLRQFLPRLEGIYRVQVDLKKMFDRLPAEVKKKKARSESISRKAMQDLLKNSPAVQRSFAELDTLINHGGGDVPQASNINPA